MTGEAHLSEEALAAEAVSISPSSHPHLRECALCRARLALARDLLRVDGIGPDGDSEHRAASLIRRLEAARGADSDPARVAVRWPVEGGLALAAHGAEVFARSPALTLRRAARPLAVPLGCRRQFGDYEVEVEVTPSPGGAAGLVDVGVRLRGPLDGRATAALILEERELAVRPLSAGRTSFREIEPGRYTLALVDRRVVVGRVHLDVEGPE